MNSRKRQLKKTGGVRKGKARFVKKTIILTVPPSHAGWGVNGSTLGGGTPRGAKPKHNAPVTILLPVGFRQPKQKQTRRGGGGTKKERNVEGEPFT